MVASFDDRNSSNSKQTKLVREAFAWAANPVSNLKSQWTAPDDTAHGVSRKTSRIAFNRELLKDDVESVDVLVLTAFLKKKKKKKRKVYIENLSTSGNALEVILDILRIFVWLGRSCGELHSGTVLGCCRFFYCLLRGRKGI